MIRLLKLSMFRIDLLQCDGVGACVGMLHLRSPRGGI
jgi:hypothetical protein